MNINMLRDTDNDPGFYAAVTSPDPKWPGCALFQSGDNGATYQQIASITNAVTMGRTVNALGDFAGGNIPDETNALRVRMVRGSLSSVPYASFLNGAQAAIIGDEIVFFRDAVLNSDGTYTVSGFLRGRRGSEYAMSKHAAGERFILADMALSRIAGVTADLHVPKLYKAVTAGGSLAKTVPSSFTNDGAGLRPYAPALVGGGFDASGNLTINWTRRTRISGEWRNSVNVPLGEESEAYEVEIWNADYTTLKRTITDITSPSTVYAAADQASDFGSAQSEVHLAVFQLSAIVGRGYGTRATVRASGDSVPNTPAPVTVTSGGQSSDQSPPPPPPPPPPSGQSGFQVGARPFASSSSWNTPIPAGAAYTPMAWPAATGYNYWANWDSYSPSIYTGSSTDPIVTVSYPTSWGYPAGTVSIHLAAGISGASGTDGEILIIDGTTIHNFWQFSRTGPNSATAQAYARTDAITGSGWGQATPFLGAGIVAAGSSQYAGLLVQAETDAGEINHALQIALEFTLQSPGHVGQAIAGDGSSGTGIGVEGERYAIPPSMLMPSGLSALGQKVFRAMQTYGVFNIDKAGVTTLRMQANAYDASTVNALRADVNVLIPLLQRVN